MREKEKEKDAIIVKWINKIRFYEYQIYIIAIISRTFFVKRLRVKGKGEGERETESERKETKNRSPCHATLIESILQSFDYEQASNRRQLARHFQKSQFPTHTNKMFERKRDREREKKNRAKG